MVASILKLSNKAAPWSTSADRSFWRTTAVRFSEEIEALRTLLAITPPNATLLRWSETPPPVPGNGWWIDDADPFTPDTE